ncbi:MAG TPA: TonB-dependent copper receptor [Azospira sp.]|nr:TonB-dependent copper receptor [Azospira sp.]
MSLQPSRLALAITLAFSGSAFAADTSLEDVVVTAPRMEEPLKVVTDPKAPRQPLPAHDGADFLKAIPGFSVIRKGGTDGDPVLRGMAGSRLNILLDGEQILGGCGNRMDPPTAYVFPEAYDRVTVIKGPQTVLYGPGNSAGTVLFERNVQRFAAPGVKFNGSLLGGSFGRNDAVADLRAGNPEFYVQGTATNSRMDDYRDGDGNTVHSRYQRWSANGAVGWTPDDNTRLELSAAHSDGQAAYADRSMDGTKFARDNLGLKFEKRNLSALVEKLEAQAFYNYVDHVMDNYTLRQVSGKKMVSNPDRETVGGRVAATLRLADLTKLVLGLDTQSNKHTIRSSMDQDATSYTSKNRAEDAQFRNVGIFGELTHWLGERDRVVAGLRADQWHAEDQRRSLTFGMTTKANPTAGNSRNDTLTSGFGRFERDLLDLPATVYAGLGHTERFPDYWELIGGTKESTNSLSAFNTKPEKTTQVDLGMTYKSGRTTGGVSAFYNKIDDYILVQSNYVKPAFMGPGTRTTSIVRNVDATTWGAEANLGYALSDTWKVDGTLAYVRGNNDTDGTPLAQLPPLEARLGATYDNKVWSVGSLLRLAARQDRVSVNQGNIVGQDIGETGGFAVFSVNAGYRPKKGVLVSGGVDNLFNRTYAEAISRAGTMISGFDQTTRVNEPGRTLWLKAQVALD